MDIIFCNENSTFEAEKYIIKVYKCLICGIEFNFKPDLRKHIEKQHLDFILTPKIKNEAIDKTEIKTEPEVLDPDIQPVSHQYANTEPCIFQCFWCS